ncbi:MAG: hypothetical protein WCP92_02980 [bacterium]
MRDYYGESVPERELSDPETREDLDSLYDEISTTPPLEDDGTHETESE